MQIKTYLSAASGNIWMLNEKKMQFVFVYWKQFPAVPADPPTGRGLVDDGSSSA